MKEALNKWTRKYVYARDADRSDSYLCPDCNAPVSLRSGWAIDAYFAHLQGVSHADCALYVASLAQGHSTSAATSALHPRPWCIGLGLKLIGPTGRRAWSLEISVPTGRATEGEIVIDIGGRSQKIILTENGEDFRCVTAEPQSQPYRILNVKPSNSTVSLHLETSCEGMREVGVTVFGDVNRPGREPLPRVAQLSCARSYVFIWPTGTDIQFPDELRVEHLQNLHSWHGALITLPVDVSTTCSIWVEQLTLLKIRPATPAIIPVWPPLIKTITRSVIEAPRDISTIIFVCPNGEQHGKYGPALFSRCKGAEQVLRANGPLEPFFKITPQTGSPAHLACRDTISMELAIDFTLAPHTYQSSANTSVVLVGKSRAEKDVFAELHGEQGTRWLEDVMRGEIVFHTLAMLPDVQGEVSTGRNGLWESKLLVSTSEIRAKHDSSKYEISPQIAKQLGTFMKSGLDVQIDFKGLGRVTLRAAIKKTTSPQRLPAQLRAQLKSFLIQAPHEQARRYRHTQITDEELLKCFDASRPAPESLSTKRTLEKQLQNFRTTKHYVSKEA